MKIFIVDQGLWEDNEIVLVTTDFDEALNYVVSYTQRHKDKFCGHISMWENSKEIYEYGRLNTEIINNQKILTYDELKNDIIKFSGVKV